MIDGVRRKVRCGAWPCEEGGRGQVNHRCHAEPRGEVGVTWKAGLPSEDHQGPGGHNRTLAEEEAGCEKWCLEIGPDVQGSRLDKQNRERGHPPASPTPRFGSEAADSEDRTPCRCSPSHGAWEKKEEKSLKNRKNREEDKEWNLRPEPLGPAARIPRKLERDRWERKEEEKV